MPGCLIGAAGGPLQAAWRSLLIRLAPKSDRAIFRPVRADRSHSSIRPLLIGVITAVTPSQKAGMAVLVVFFRRGMALMRR